MATGGMCVLERAVYRGPHLYGRRPMIRIQLDLGALEDLPSNTLPDLPERLAAMLPGLAAHGCSDRVPGGFLRRLGEGTWLGHVIEHVALELQTMAGARATRGKTRSVPGRPGVYNVMFAYRDEVAGLAAGAYAIRLVAGLLPAGLAAVDGLARLGAYPETPADDVVAMVGALKGLLKATALGPTTASLVAAAEARGIPVARLNEASLIQLGWGSRQRRLRASITGQTSQIAVELAGDKAATKRLLGEAGLPVPQGAVVRTADEAVVAAERLGFPVVVKPLDGNHGRGVTTGLGDGEAVKAAFDRAVAISRQVIVEQQLPGNDHRILVVGGRMVAAAERVPAQVVGDGFHSITQLIEFLNADPRRGRGHEKVLTRILPDAAMRDLLAKAGKTLASVPMAGEVVRLRGTANLSTGGTAVDRTGAMHPDNIAIAEAAAAVIGLDVCGIDFLSPDIARPVRETGGGIVEVNAAPGFRMHLEPSSGEPRDVAEPVIETLFPRGRRSRIPVIAITGTNGKSTTVRMVARILREAGRNVGFTSTSGIYLNGHLLTARDASGPKSARAVLRNPTVDVAVLETARGGILREGLGFDRCDIGAVLNVAADHLGLKGVDTLEQLADVKSVVTGSVARRGFSVLNADDPMIARVARRAGGRPVWFSLQGAGAMDVQLAAHIAGGGLAALREAGPDGGTLVLHRGGAREVLIAAADIPATMEGKAEFNIANALAAAAICAAHGVPAETIRRGLAGFTSSFEDNPGRLNVHDANGFRTLVDYAHNPAGLIALGDLIAKMRIDHPRVIGMVSIPGDRRDEDILEMGRLAAGMFDEVVFREAPDGRGRARGAISALLSQGAIEAGMAGERVHRVNDEFDAAIASLTLANPGDLVVLLPTQVEEVWQRALDFVAPAVEPAPAVIVRGTALA